MEEMEENILQKNGKTFRGIDVSHWNKDIDWEAVAKSGIQFAMLKCMNESNNVDKCFEANYQGCIDAGIYVGVYIYVVAVTKRAAKTAIDKLLEILQSREIKYGVWLDIEAGRLLKLPRKDLIDIVNFMLGKLHKAGYTAGVYCNYSWYQAIFKGESCLFWIARYPARDDGKLYPQSDPGVGVCWQFSSHGSVDGVSGRVDMDIAKVDISKIEVDKFSVPDKIWKRVKENIPYFKRM